MKILTPFLARLVSCLCLVLVLGGGASTAFAQNGMGPLRDATGESQRLFALVIGSNATLNPEQSPLRFADDDAARLYELLLEVGADAELVTLLDQDSQATFPALVERARRQTRDDVLAAHEKLVGRMQTARQQGASNVDYLIYYSGHGDVGPDGQGYLTLGGGSKLDRHDLFAKLLGTSPAHFNHIVIDACRSEELVLSRGDGWQEDRSAIDFSQAVSKYLDSRHLGNFPNTGVILASSADQQTHEWESYRGGVFSHELLSGLRGGADVNGDGRIEYSELGAFVSAANSGVADVRARLRVVVKPPETNQRRALLEHKDIAERRVLLFPSADRYRYSVEDTRGMRVADVRRSGEQPGYLRLPEGKLFVYREDGAQAEESAIDAPEQGAVYAEKLAFTPVKQQHRGALAQAFHSGLFSVPYGVGYYAGYTDTHGLLAVEKSEWEVTIWRKVDDAEKPEERDVARDTTRKTEPEDNAWGPRHGWGAFSFAAALSLPSAADEVRTNPGTLSANQFDPWMGPIQGLEVSWGMFQFENLEKDDIEGEIFARSGYYRGDILFTRDESSDVESYRYQKVPLFIGFNGYFPGGFRQFPIKPYAGGGVGLDMLHITLPERTDFSLSVGAEVHGGFAVWITDHIGIATEARYLWSDDRELNDAPDMSLDGLTIGTRLSIAFPLSNDKRQKAHDDAEHLRVAVRHGDEEVVIERSPENKVSPSE